VAGIAEESRKTGAGPSCPQRDLLV